MNESTSALARVKHVSFAPLCIGHGTGLELIIIWLFLVALCFFIQTQIPAKVQILFKLLIEG